MESQEKKLAVVAGKRAVDEGDSPDASMEDLCRKKFKPIAPKPVIRKDHHQAVLSAALPLKKDVSQRKEHVVLPSPKFDPSSAFVMRPGSSFPFMCGGPMIMPIPVPVVPGKDGSYVPLQVPVPIPVMVPIVVTLGQAMSPSASQIPATVTSDSKRSNANGAEDSSGSNNNVNNNQKKGSLKHDKGSDHGDAADNKTPKSKPCRYKYSMIKNGSFFRDLLRGAGGGFMASHGISLAMPPNTSVDTNNMSKNISSTDPSSHDSNQSQNQPSSLEKSVVSSGSDQENAGDKDGKDATNTEAVGGVPNVRTEHDKNGGGGIQSSDTNQFMNFQPFPTRTCSSNVHIAQPSAVTGTGTCGAQTPTYSSYVTVATSTSSQNSSSFPLSLSTNNNVAPAQYPFCHSQSTSSPAMYSNTRPSEGPRDRVQSHKSAAPIMCSSSPAVSVSAASSQPYSSPYATPSSHRSDLHLSSHIQGSRAPGLHTHSATGTVTARNNTSEILPTSSSVHALAPVGTSHSQWNFPQGPATPGHEQTRAVHRPFHNLAQRIASLQNSEHDQPDDPTNFYSMDELHSFSEMDQSAGSLLSSSDDSVNAVLSMNNVSGSGPESTALSDSPTRRAVTAIVTPLPRSIPLSTCNSTITTVASQGSQIAHGSAQATSGNAEPPPVPVQRPSDQNSRGRNIQGTTHDNRAGQTLVPSSQQTQPWPAEHNHRSARPNLELAARLHPSNIHPEYSESVANRNQSGATPSFAAHRMNQQPSTAGSISQSRQGSKTVASQDQVSAAQGYVRSSNSSVPTVLSSSLTQRPPATTPFINMPSTNPSSRQSNTANVSFHASSGSSAVGYNSQNGVRNPLQCSQSLEDTGVVRSAPSRFPPNVSSQNELALFPRNNATERSPSNREAGQSNRASEGQRTATSALPTSDLNNLTTRSQSLQVPSVCSNLPASSNFSSNNIYSQPRLPLPCTTQSQSNGIAKRGNFFPPSGVQHSQSYPRPDGEPTSGASPSVSNMWQPHWTGGVPARHTHPSFSSDTSDSQRAGMGSDMPHRRPPNLQAPSGRSGTISTVMTSSSVQSVPLQSNLQSRMSMTETMPTSSQPGSHLAVNIPNTRACPTSQSQVTGPMQPPAFSASNQRHSMAEKPSSGGFSGASGDIGPRMPYPLVPPIMFGNSAPARSISVGGLHNFPLPGAFPSTSLADQYIQPPRAVASSPSSVHRSVTPVLHDRHRMYLPSHYSTLHRPLYMPPSPTPSTDLPLLSPHSYGQLHVHDSVLYSPRYPSSIHSLSPGINSNYHSSAIHRSVAPSSHQDTLTRSEAGHSSSHYDGVPPSIPLCMPQLDQSAASAVSAANARPSIPPTIAALQHSSIVANREQNSLFEQNLQRLLERSARRHTAMLASANGFPRSVPCEHSFPHRSIADFSTFPSFASPHSGCSVSFSTPSMQAAAQSCQPHPAHLPAPRPPVALPATSSHSPILSTTVATSAVTLPTTLSGTVTPTTSTIVTSRAVLGNTSDKYLPLELVAPETPSNPPQTSTATPSVSTPAAQVASEQVVKCGDTVLQCSRQVLRESGRTVLCCWFCDYHTAEPRKMKRHQKKESEPMKCQLCSYQSDSRCSVNQHYKQEHMDKDDPFRSVPH